MTVQYGSGGRSLLFTWHQLGTGAHRCGGGCGLRSGGFWPANHNTGKNKKKWAGRCPPRGRSMEGTEGVNSQPGNAGNTEQDGNVLKVKGESDMLIIHAIHHTASVIVKTYRFSPRIKGTIF